MQPTYKEGEYVAGKGTYMPDGAFSGAPTEVTPSVTPSPAATSPSPVPKFGDEVKDASGKVVGTAAFDPNTGKALDQPKVQTPKVSVNRSIYDDMGGANKAQNVEQVQADMTRSAQGEINALNQYAQSLLAEQATINQKNDRSTNAISTLTGLAGSTEADTAQQKTTDAGQRANKAIKDEAALKVQSILGRVKEAAIAESRAQREEARMVESDRIANRKARQEEAVTNLQNLAASGVTFEGLKTSDPKGYEYLAKQFGGEQALKGAFTLNIPQDQILDKKLEGGKYVVVRQNPITQKITVETLDTGLPTGYSKTIDAGNRILAVPDNWDGDPSKLISINKGLTPSQGGVSGGGVYSNDLDAIVGTVLSTIPTKFGQATFADQLKHSRDDADKINLVAAQVLKGQPAEFKNDFRNQAVGISEVEKAIKLIDDGVQTGVINNGLQYTFNLAGKDYDPKLAQLNSYLTAAIQPYRNSVTGAAWGDQEDDEYQSLFGSTKYSPSELRSRLVNVKELLKSKSAQGLNSFVNPLGYYDNAFESGAYTPGGETVVGADGQEYVFTD